MSYIINNIEIWTEKSMNEALKDINMCKCSKCLKDTYALALNKLDPYYIVADKGLECDKLDEEYKKAKDNIIEKIKEAAEVIRKNPRHNNNDEVEDVINYAELFVKDYLKTILKEESDTLSNDRYINEIYVMVLNNTKPMYSVTKNGEMYRKIQTEQGQYKTSIFLEITKAIEIINMRNKSTTF